MRNLKIGVKITIGFGVVLLCIAILTVSVFVSAQMTNAQLEFIEELSDFQCGYTDFVNYFNDARIGIRVLVYTHNEEQYSRAVNSINQANTVLRHLADEAARVQGLEGYRGEIENLRSNIAQWNSLVNELHISNEALYDMRGQFDDMLVAAIELAHENIYYAQLENLMTNIQEGSDAETLLRRHARVEHGANLLFDIQRIEAMFYPLIAYHDLTAASDSIAFGESVMVSLDKYIEDSSQQKNKDDAQYVKDALISYFGLIDNYIAEINNLNRIREAYEAQAQSILPIVDATILNINNDVLEAILRAEALGGRLIVIAVALAIVAIISGVIVAVYLINSISTPLVALSAFMVKAGKTGDTALAPKDIEIIGKFAKNKDEVGELIASTAEFVGELNQEMDMLEQIADGDLTITPNVLSEKDKVGNSLKKVVDSLNHMFTEINSATTQVSTGSKQVADIAQALAQGTTEQAASIQELSSSIAEIAERTKANAATAEKTSKLSATIRGNAEKGSLHMDEMIAAVGDINEASKSISKIIKTIDDIAFQTNILALNAAVEAARAGQHGKGFAVVAEEVRNLASKSAEAARDTGIMIQNSVEKSELGTRIAGETAASLMEIVTGISESSQLAEEIAISSEEQALGISQINTGVDQVAQVVQQNSASAQETAAASQEMSGQSDMLAQLISKFKLKNGASPHSLPTENPPVRVQHGLPEKAGNFGKY